MTKDKGNFPTRFKMDVVVGGEVVERVKSKHFKHILDRKDELKGKYHKDEVDFNIVASNVIKCNKPRYKTFSNVQDWGVHYGVNSDGGYYLANEDYSKVIRLIEVY